MEYRTMLPCTPEAIPVAREIVASNLPAGSSPEAEFALQLLTSEVATNAIRHSGCTELDSVALRLKTSSGRLRVEIEDVGPGFEMPISPLAEVSRLGGFGLVLLNEIAQDWGVQPGPPTVVWFEVPVPSSEG